MHAVPLTVMFWQNFTHNTKKRISAAFLRCAVHIIYSCMNSENNKKKDLEAGDGGTAPSRCRLRGRVLLAGMCLAVNMAEN